ncbi:TerB N-terminal domain-containing protein, partial [Roseobacter sp. HKCCD8198]
MASSVSSRSTKSGWVPSSETASVAGRNIGGMVYVGTPPLLNSYGYRDKCRAYIDPSLSVARSGTDKAGDGMPYAMISTLRSNLSQTSCRLALNCKIAAVLDRGPFKIVGSGCLSNGGVGLTKAAMLPGTG